MSTWQKILIMMFVFSVAAVVAIYFFIQRLLVNMALPDDHIQGQRIEYENETIK